MRCTGIAVVVTLALGASACEGSTPSAAPEATSVSESPPASSPTATEPGGPHLRMVIRPFGGYSFFESALDETPVARLKKRFRPSDYLALSASIVTKDEDPIALLVHLLLSRTARDLAGEDRDFLLEYPAEAMLGSAGHGGFEVMTIGGQEVWTAEGDAGVLYAWRDRRPVVGILLGEDAQATEAFLSDYIARKG